MAALWAKLVRAGRGLRAKWAEVSFEKKLGMFVAPVFVAVTSALVLTLITGSDDDDGGGRASTDVTTATTTIPNGFSGRGVRIAGLAVADAGDSTRIDVTLRNGDAATAFVRRARFRVAEFRTVSACLPQAYLLPSHTYDLILPADDAKGKVVDVDLSQTIGAGELDRIRFRVGLDKRNLTNTTSYLYRLDVSLEHDGEAKPVRAGAVAVTKPFPDKSWFFAEDQPADVQRCAERNRTDLAAVLAGAGSMSPELRALALSADVRP